MDDSGMYAAACEIREAVSELRRSVEDELTTLQAIASEQPTRRSEFAGRLFVMLMEQKPEHLQVAPSNVDEELKLIASAAWRLADLLDKADPHPDEVARRAALAAEDSGIDLGEEQRRMDEDHRRRHGG